MLQKRLEEAHRTGADVMTTVCHYCSQVFTRHQDSVPFAIDNYINMLAAAVGIHREDRFRRYAGWQDTDRILADAEPLIETSPFSRSLIEKTVREVFAPDDL